jgi:hypothetical protein
LGLTPLNKVLFLDPPVVLDMLENALKLPHTESFFFMVSSVVKKLTRFLSVDGSREVTSITSSNALNTGGELVTLANLEFASLTISSASSVL